MEKENIDTEVELDKRYTATEHITIRGKRVPFNTHLYKNLMHIKEGIKKKFDGILVVDGMEGSGKSELAFQCALIINEDFNDKDIFYSVDQFEEWLENTKIGSAGVWDEFALAGLSADALSSLQILLIKKFVLIRKKRLFIALVIPYFFMLQRYFAISRTRALIHNYTKGYERGYFRFYNYDKKRKIYTTGYKHMDYTMGKVFPNFEGRNTAWSEYFIDDKIVQAKKDKAIEQIGFKGLKITKRRAEVLEHIFCNLIANNPYDVDISKADYFVFRRMKEDLLKFNK